MAFDENQVDDNILDTFLQQSQNQSSEFSVVELGNGNTILHFDPNLEETMEAFEDIYSQFANAFKFLA